MDVDARLNEIIEGLDRLSNYDMKKDCILLMQNTRYGYLEFFSKKIPYLIDRYERARVGSQLLVWWNNEIRSYPIEGEKPNLLDFMDMFESFLKGYVQKLISLGVGSNPMEFALYSAKRMVMSEVIIELVGFTDKKGVLAGLGRLRWELYRKKGV